MVRLAPHAELQIATRTATVTTCNMFTQLIALEAPLGMSKTSHAAEPAVEVTEWCGALAVEVLCDAGGLVHVADLSPPCWLLMQLAIAGAGRPLSLVAFCATCCTPMFGRCQWGPYSQAPSAQVSMYHLRDANYYSAQHQWADLHLCRQAPEHFNVCHQRT